jgi:hypothetical protein
MGFLDTAPGTDLPAFYNVVHAVGKSCPNWRDDVKLIQYLLIALYEKSAELKLSKPGGEMAVTGYCGPVTMHWIMKFQMDCNQRSPRSVAMDGRIDRIRQKDFIGSISKTLYGLSVLNFTVAEFNPAAFAALPALVPLQNPLNVPPPSWDMVNQQPQIVPASGGM